MRLDDVPDLAADYHNLLQLIYQDSCSALCVLVIRRTPVDMGVLRASWTPAINHAAGRNQGGNYHAVSRRLRIGDKFLLINSQPYARPIEYEGYSRQAPAGMLRISVAQWPQIVLQQANRHVR